MISTGALRRVCLALFLLACGAVFVLAQANQGDTTLLRVFLKDGKEVKRDKIKLPKRSEKNAYDDQASLRGRKFVPEKY